MFPLPDKTGRHTLAILFVVGLALRLPGLLGNGMADVFEFILDWGFDVRALGLARGLDVNYGILSYAAFGLAADLGESFPRFWWAPYKLITIAFDAGVLAALLQIVRPVHARLVLALYWLNPWVIIHGAYQGFWEGAYLLCGLLAVLALRRADDDSVAWGLVGTLLLCSGLFKPQGLIHFAAPVMLFLAVQYARGQRTPLTALVMGVASVGVVTTAAIWLGGGSMLALYDNFGSSLSVMANLSNGGPNVWRSISFVGMDLAGQAGEVTDFRPGRIWIGGLSLLAGLICVTVLLRLAIQVSIKHSGTTSTDGWLSSLAARLGPPKVSYPADAAVLLFLMLGSLVMSQFGVRAHINHTFGATVLLIPFVLANRRLMPYWVVMTTVQAVVHLARHGLGAASLLPPESAWRNYPNAEVFISRITQLPAFAEPDSLLRFQRSLNEMLAHLAGPATAAVLSLVMFVCTICVLRELFKELGRGPLVNRPPP